jgi:hypothetical protein
MVTASHFQAFSSWRPAACNSCGARYCRVTHIQYRFTRSMLSLVPLSLLSGSGVAVCNLSRHSTLQLAIRSVTPYRRRRVPYNDRCSLQPPWVSATTTVLPTEMEKRNVADRSSALFCCVGSRVLAAAAAAAVGTFGNSTCMLATVDENGGWLTSSYRTDRQTLPATLITAVDLFETPSLITTQPRLALTPRHARAMQQQEDQVSCPPVTPALRPSRLLLRSGR